MSGSNQLGPLTTMRQVRKGVIELAQTWLPTYIADACRAEGLAPDAVVTPNSWTAANEVTKWPEQQLPALIAVAPGLRAAPEQRGNNMIAPWVVNLTAVVHGQDDDDTEMQASVYGAALRAMFVQQAGKCPGLAVEGKVYEDEAYDVLPQRRARSLMAASVTFTLRVKDHVQVYPGLSTPDPDPIGDPGAYPAADPTKIEVSIGH